LTKKYGFDSISIGCRGLLELRWYWIVYDTKTLVVGANGRSPLRQRFRNFMNSDYHSNSNRPGYRFSGFENNRISFRSKRFGLF